MAPLFELDPTSEDAANSPLEIWSTTDYSVTAVTFSAPPLSIQWAGSVDTEGSLPSSRKYENRQISVTVDVASAAGLRNLQAKVAKIAREGGTAKQTFPNSEVVVWDLHAADTFEPQFDVTYYTNTGTFCTVQFTLVAKPVGRGPAVTTLSSHAATTKQPNVFTETGIKGDIPALANIRVTNVGTNSKGVVIWGVQSRYYDSASTAALFLESETATPQGSSAADPGPSGASGGGTNKTMLCNNVGTGANKQLVFTGLTHVGSFRVYARVQAPSANTGIVSVNLGWTPPSTGNTIQNDSISLVDSGGAAAEGAWYLVDLGLVNITQARLGTHSWSMNLYAGSTVTTDDLYADWFALVPVDEGSGIVTGFTAATSRAVDIGDHDVLYQSTATKWVRPTYEGDYVRLPVAGLEARTLRVITISTGADLNGDRQIFHADDLDADTTQIVSYTPRYLTVPSP